MVDKNCIHYEVCSYSGTVFETCEKCQFRKHRMIDTNRHIVDVDKFLRALDEHGSDVCEHDSYGLCETLHGFSYDTIQEVVEACQEHAEEMVGVCIEHPWAEEENGLLIPEFECPFCHSWHKESAVDKYCTQCGKPIVIVHKERKE